MSCPKNDTVSELLSILTNLVREVLSREFNVFFGYHLLVNCHYKQVDRTKWRRKYPTLYHSKHSGLMYSLCATGL